MSNLRIAKCCFSCNHTVSASNGNDDEIFCIKYSYYAKKFHLCDSYSAD